MSEFIQQENGYRKEEIILIGDNYDTDIQAGIRFGIDTIHVAGGVTFLEEVLLKSQQPTYLYRTLLELDNIKRPAAWNERLAIMSKEWIVFYILIDALSQFAICISLDNFTIDDRI